VHGLSQTPSATDTIDGAKHDVFKNGNGTVVVESFDVPGMQHGVAIAAGKKCGTASTYALDKNICTARHIATFFGLVGASAPTPGSDAGVVKPGSGSSSSSSSGGGDGRDAGAASPGGGAPPSNEPPAEDTAASTCALKSGRSDGGSGLFAILGAGVAIAVVRRVRRRS